MHLTKHSIIVQGDTLFQQPIALQEQKGGEEETMLTMMGLRFHLPSKTSALHQDTQVRAHCHQKIPATR